ncbi:DnaJ domain-containing protein [Thiomicrorhabdus sp. zzn3]|uniref:DnaJ domain-containing protein n=1 Tax=Thiomicrorhabdus sp. zzn3 TaxID=3039775 RepID=UPI00243639CF|nr:DnaJ domain-containing protein [Thiomicrorhabdus sp. zzn3]MDG6777869.1 DnaJ domain-containing protein [Thiomicrorhabdus sp. zzn3]
MASYSQYFDPTIDYFSVLGVHQNACSKTIKIAYRKLARRYHPDVSKIHDATKKFQQVAEAYEILSKHRDAYWQEFMLRKRKPTHSKPNRTAARNAKASNTRSQSSNQGSTDFTRNCGHKPINGKNRAVTYPLTLRYAIRLLRIGYFYIPGLKVKMKFTRQALQGKTFRLKGKGYSGLYGGKAGDYLVRFEIKNENLQWKLKDGDIYATYEVAGSMLTAGNQLHLYAPSGGFSLKVPHNYSSERFICIENMGLPPDEETEAGHLYARLIAA